ncbi:MAG: sigma 54-interacting transcriptional regulator [Myxococcota bacterium]
MPFDATRLPTTDAYDSISTQNRDPAAARCCYLDRVFPAEQLRIVVDKERLIVGRDRFVRVNQEPDSRISVQHFALTRSTDGWSIADLSSRNGTYINGRKLSDEGGELLEDGSVIRIGDTVLVFRGGHPSDLPSAEEAQRIPGRSPSIAFVRRRLHQAAQLKAPILLLGETGTGKEFAARWIHDFSHSRNQPFVAVNCAELDAQLARSELFGVEKGAFTDAKVTRPGLIAQAEDGTVFFDELGDMDTAVQADLLRFTQDQTYRRVGGLELRHSAARLVAATNVHIDDAVESGAFRRDLLARLLTIEPIQLPALRDRREDIGDWVANFMVENHRSLGISPKPLTAGAMESLLIYTWPENLRGLRRAVASAALQASTSEKIDAKHLPAAIYQFRLTVRKSSRPSPPLVPVAFEPAKQIRPSREDMITALRNTGGVVIRAAQTLHIDRRKFYRLCAAYDIFLPDYRIGRVGQTSDPPSKSST